MPNIRRFLILFILIPLTAFLAARWAVAWVSREPDNLGVTNGRLAPCPDSPNCVSTFATDEMHGMEPMGYEGETAVAQTALLTALNSLPRITIVRNEPGYIHAEARSALWGFVDDVEFAFDETAGLIHFRSASRLGYGDMGVNRTRLETIRATFESSTP